MQLNCRLRGVSRLGRVLFGFGFRAAWFLRVFWSDGSLVPRVDASRDCSRSSTAKQRRRSHNSVQKVQTTLITWFAHSVVTKAHVEARASRASSRMVRILVVSAANHARC